MSGQHRGGEIAEVVQGATEMAAGAAETPSSLWRLIALPVAVGVLATTVAACTSTHESTPRSPSATVQPDGQPRPILENLLQDDFWQDTPGINRVRNGLYVRWTGRGIVHQDGSAGQPNHPINYGLQINTPHGFKITAAMANINKSAVLQLYGEPPVILDEQRFDPASLRINLEEGVLYTDMWAGADQDRDDLQTDHVIPHKKSYKLTVQDSGGQITIGVDGQTVRRLSDRGIFHSGRLWLGLDSDSPGGNWMLQSLAVRPAAGAGMLSVSHPLDTVYINKKSDGLQQLADKVRPGFKIGTAVSIGPLVSDSTYRRIAADGDFGQFTTENAGKAQFVEPARGIFNYGEEDEIARFAKRNGISLHGHTAVFGEANPRWMTELAQKYPEQMKSVMKSLIRHDVQRYKGEMTSYDVVDEPLSDYQNYLLRKTIWYNSIGPGYIADAFRIAHAANPGLELDWNDYGLEQAGERWNSFFAYIKHLKLVEHVPIDAVGFESHVYAKDTDTIDPAVLREHIRALARIGLKSRISEIDVEGDNGPAFQSEQFSAVLKACLAEPSCISYTTWGLGGKYGSTSWVDPSGLHYGNGQLCGIRASNPSPPTGPYKTRCADKK